MALTGAEIKTAILGDAVNLVNATNYTLSVEDIRVSVAYSYTVTPTGPGDDGNRAFRRTVQLSKSDFDVLDSASKIALRDAIEAKIQ